MNRLFDPEHRLALEDRCAAIARRAPGRSQGRARRRAHSFRPRRARRRRQVETERGEKPNRAIEISEGKRARFVALFALEPLRAGRIDFGSDR